MGVGGPPRGSASGVLEISKSKAKVIDRETGPYAAGRRRMKRTITTITRESTPAHRDREANLLGIWHSGLDRIVMVY